MRIFYIRTRYQTMGQPISRLIHNYFIDLNSIKIKLMLLLLQLNIWYIRVRCILNLSIIYIVKTSPVIINSIRNIIWILLLNLIIC